jgi:hypothetical protein
LSAIKGSDGLNMTQISALFGNHRSLAVDAAVASLINMKLIAETVERTGGRPQTIFTLRREQR